MTRQKTGLLRRILGAMAMDLTPLRVSRDYRLLYTVQFISAFGSAISHVVLPWHMMLPVIGLGVVYLRHRHLPKDIRPSRWVTVGLWVATALIVWLMSYSVIETLRKML